MRAGCLLTPGSLEPSWPECSGLDGALEFGGPWLALGFQGVESLPSLTSGSRVPCLHSAWLNVRPGRRKASRGSEVATCGALRLPFLKRLQPLALLRFVSLGVQRGTQSTLTDFRVAELGEISPSG